MTDKQKAKRILPCHYHESRYRQLDCIHDYEANGDYQNHFQTLDQKRKGGTPINNVCTNFNAALERYPHKNQFYTKGQSRYQTGGQPFQVPQWIS